MGMSTCGSVARSTTPGTPAMMSRTCCPRLRSLYRSSPKIFTATLVRLPESMWSIRWAIGCPTVMFMPGTSDRSPRRSARNAAFDLPGGSVYDTSISADSTPWACSSSSARPVLRAIPVTSGCDITTRSTARPSLSDSASEVPGMVTALMESAPSLNSGQEGPPQQRHRRRHGDDQDKGRRGDQPGVAQRPVTARGDRAI